MIQYNVTIQIEPEVESEWVEYMRHQHIKDVLATGLFLKCHLSKLIKGGGEDPTYTVQYFLASMKAMHEYEIKHARRLQEEHSEKFEGKFVSFRTLMEVIDEKKVQQQHQNGSDRTTAR